MLCISVAPNANFGNPSLTSYKKIDRPSRAVVLTAATDKRTCGLRFQYSVSTNYFAYDSLIADSLQPTPLRWPAFVCKT